VPSARRSRHAAGAAATAQRLKARGTPTSGCCVPEPGTR
jgi:hypothetical protein